MITLRTVLFVGFLTTQVLAWENLPNIPTGRRSQFHVIHEDGAYKYGYDTGDGHAAKQEADTANQVKGHYFYRNGAGKEVDLKYTSGVQGFVPENLEKIEGFIRSSSQGAPPATYLPAAPAVGYLPVAQVYASSEEGDDDSGAYKPDNSGDYNPEDTGEYKPDSAGGSSPDDSGEYQPDNSGDSSDDTGEYKPDNSGDSNPDDSGEYKADSSGDYNEQSSSGDASYAFNIDTASYKRTESSDAGGNVQGSYSYNNQAGNHDLQYVAGAGTGFVARSGSLSKPNGLAGSGAAWQSSGGYQQADAYSSNTDSGASVKGPLNPDGSYSFSFATGDHSREESGDASGNVRGRFAYQNAAGNHDLSYKAGAGTGFLVTGGSLAKANGLAHGSGSGAVSGYTYSAPSVGGVVAPVAPKGPLNPDGSYSFSFATGEQSREESGDASGNVRGRFAYQNAAGHHDLSYNAGSGTGFVVTGGSLAQPNGLQGGGGAAVSYTAGGGYSGGGYQSGSASFKSSSAASGDGSYSFGYDAGDQTRHEESDASGNVRGRYSYRNNAGSHDLSYVAGSGTGFLPTGGSLSVANGLAGGSAAISRQSAAAGSSFNIAGASGYSGSTHEDDQSDTGDASYNFSFDTPEYTRQESSDARGKVRGSYRYRNKAGTNDLSFVAGSGIGFQPTGGSLSVPNGLSGKIISAAPVVLTPNAYLPPSPPDSVEITAARSGGFSSSSQEGSSGDGSYAFAFDTDDYKRQESSDSSGNVRGSYSYKNSVGNHDLSFVAGSGTGFKPTGGSLATSPGANEAQLRAGFRNSGSSSSNFQSFIGGKDSFENRAASAALISAPHTKASYTLGNVKVHTYLPPSNDKHKFGYIFDTQ